MWPLRLFTFASCPWPRVQPRTLSDTLIPCHICHIGNKYIEIPNTSQIFNYPSCILLFIYLLFSLYASNSVSIPWPKCSVMFNTPNIYLSNLCKANSAGLHLGTVQYYYSKSALTLHTHTYSHTDTHTPCRLVKASCDNRALSQCISWLSGERKGHFPGILLLCWPCPLTRYYKYTHAHTHTHSCTICS